LKAVDDAKTLWQQLRDSVNRCGQGYAYGRVRHVPVRGGTGRSLSVIVERTAGGPPNWP
jgi:hypothetical protein